jgi:hypothetical protein
MCRMQRNSIGCFLSLLAKFCIPKGLWDLCIYCNWLSVNTRSLLTRYIDGIVTGEGCWCVSDYQCMVMVPCATDA